MNASESGPDPLARFAQERMRRPSTPPPGIPLLGRIAMEMGLLKTQQLLHALREQEEEHEGGDHILLGPILLRLGYLSPRDLDCVLAQQKKRFAASAPTPPSRCDVQAGSQVGPYEIVAELGRGGMGVVYKAYDPRLKRSVALKVIREDLAGPTFQIRLRREALALARLHHPGVVALYETGVDRGFHFVAMELVEGISLQERLRQSRVSVTRGVRIIAQAARALHHAHQQRVVHRDVKPANILLDREEAPHIVDFGLARLESERVAMTVPGELLGTPAYMAPEQYSTAIGRVGPTADLYALGATLYHIVTGRPPFVADSFKELGAKVMFADPIPPSKLQAGISPDLERVILRVLHKDPQRRYPSAADFADDLERWRRGEPVMARPLSPATRIIRRVRRHPAIAVSIVLALAGLVALANFAVPFLRRHEENRQRLVDQMRRTAQASLDAALHARRAGDLPAMDRYAAQLDETCRVAIEEVPNLAEPHYHLGRMDRARMRFNEALVHQEAALRKDPLFPPSLYERALLLSRKYRLRLQEVEEQTRLDSGIAVDLEKLRMEDSQLLAIHARISRDLKRLNGNAAAEGIWLVCDRRYAEAKSRLRDALESDPTLEEAYEAMADAEWAERNYASAIEWCTKGLDVDRGYLPHLLRRCRIRLHWGLEQEARREDPRKTWADAIADCDAVLKNRPNSSEAILLRAEAHIHLGGYQLARGATPELEYGHAVLDCDTVVRQHPTCARAYAVRAFARARWGFSQQSEEQWKLAVADSDTALKLSPDQTLALVTRANARLNWARVRQLRGEDVKDLYRQVMADSEEAWRRSSLLTDALLNRAQAATNLALCAGVEDQQSLHREAEADCASVLQADPGNARAYLVRARARVNLASLLSDPSECYMGAIADCETAMAAPGTSMEVRILRAASRVNLGAWLQQRGENPRELYAQALRDCEEGLRLDPTSAAFRRIREQVEINVGVLTSDPPER